MRRSTLRLTPRMYLTPEERAERERELAAAHEAAALSHDVQKIGGLRHKRRGHGMCCGLFRHCQVPHFMRLRERTRPFRFTLLLLSVIIVMSG